jgi:hypothetical protein
MSIGRRIDVLEKKLDAGFAEWTDPPPEPWATFIAEGEKLFSQYRNPSQGLSTEALRFAATLRASEAPSRKGEIS